MTDATAELTISRLIPAPPSLVWRAWSDPAILARWWIPAPYACRVVKLDLRPGGGLETLMREGDGPFQPHVEGCFLEAIPERRLVFTTQLAEGWRPIEPWLALTAILDFTPEDGGTRYAARVLHRSANEAQKHDEMGFEPGWGAALDQLAATVGSLG
ncbi:SRPBCC domain-containing protein [Paracoccus zhejiangensis]|uniref:Polyketide cyclase n=1 Tax=Paracoccus zhejiangensis TaxID=1077935 RepID=A0A2H5EXQ9_9RHOB|nr:SRPBCC domain-containing protein [Paracoccus zhejiangensis]AUH64053.1 polyketide cyclase [Paracoccus zhejiangensis]